MVARTTCRVCGTKLRGRVRWRYCSTRCRLAAGAQEPAGRLRLLEELLALADAAELASLPEHEQRRLRELKRLLARG